MPEVIRNPFNFTPAQGRAFRGLAGVYDHYRLACARHVGNLIDAGLSPEDAARQAKAEKRFWFFPVWEGSHWQDSFQGVAQ